jgi:hypothetical protein
VDDPVVTFTDQARQYCALIEEESVSNSWLFAQECLRSILRLYDCALLLPSTQRATVDLLDRIAHREWDATRKRISGRLQRDYYWQVFEPLETEPPQPIVGSLSDDLADIWRELKVGLLAIESKTHVASADVIWHWRFSFESHWAQHAVGAISGLNALCYGQFADSSRPELRA